MKRAPSASERSIPTTGSNNPQRAAWRAIEVISIAHVERKDDAVVRPRFHKQSSSASTLAFDKARPPVKAELIAGSTPFLLAKREYHERRKKETMSENSSIRDLLVVPEESIIDTKLQR